jgi:AcrR family transcriptional regulator
MTQATIPDQDPILDAVVRVITRYGVRRTTMNDIAREADVSRQTLYGRYTNKDGVMLAAMEYVVAQMLAQVRADWGTQDTLSEKLWSFFDHTTIRFYTMVQQMPDAEDLISGGDKESEKASHQMMRHKMAMLEPLFIPHQAALAQNGQTAEDLAEFIVTTCNGLKYGATSEQKLEQMLETLRLMVLKLVGEA